MPADPYRVNDAAPRRTGLVRERSTTSASALPLAVVAITFFLPFTKTCSESVASPLSESTKDLGSFFLLAPTFFTAAVLAVAIVYTFVTKRSATHLALAATAWSVLAAGWVIVASFGKDNAWILFVATAACAPLYGFAWSSRGLRSLSLLVDAYLFASLPVAALVTISAQFYGAYLFIAAFALLALMRAFELMSRIAGALRGARRVRAHERHPAR
jgi:hypothetical protein